jgi:RNA-directed DNA polymerase
MLSNREMVATKLQRIAEKARRESGCRFTSLFHLMNVEMLRECFRQLRKDAAAGIDKVTKKEYGANLEKKLDGSSREVAPDVLYPAAGT